MNIDLHVYGLGRSLTFRSCLWGLQKGTPDDETANMDRWCLLFEKISRILDQLYTKAAAAVAVFALYRLAA